MKLWLHIHRKSCWLLQLVRFPEVETTVVLVAWQGDLERRGDKEEERKGEKEMEGEGTRGEGTRGERMGRDGRE